MREKVGSVIWDWKGRKGRSRKPPPPEGQPRGKPVFFGGFPEGNGCRPARERITQTEEATGVQADQREGEGLTLPVKRFPTVDLRMLALLWIAGLLKC